MPRAYVQYTTSIWNDDDFRDLTARQQALYFLLRGQAEVTAAGVLPLRPRRWSRMASDWTPDGIEEVLADLEQLGHVVTDETTEELLVVKFVKWDGGYTNSKRIPVIRDAALGVESPKLRRKLAGELHRLGLSDVASRLTADAPPDNPSDALSKQRADTPPDALSDRESGFDRVGVKQGDHQSNPQPATSNQQPGDRAERDAPSGTPAAAVRAYVAACPKPPAEALQARVERQARQLVAEGHPPDLVVAAAGNAGRAGWTDLAVQMQRDATTARAAPARRTTDDRVRDGLAIAQRLAQQQTREHREIGPSR